MFLVSILRPLRGAYIDIMGIGVLEFLGPCVTFSALLLCLVIGAMYSAILPRTIIATRPCATPVSSFFGRCRSYYSVVANLVFPGGCYLCFLYRSYVSFAPRHVSYNVSIRFRLFYRVWIHSFYVDGSWPFSICSIVFIPIPYWVSYCVSGFSPSCLFICIVFSRRFFISYFAFVWCGWFCIPAIFIYLLRILSFSPPLARLAQLLAVCAVFVFTFPRRMLFCCRTHAVAGIGRSLPLNCGGKEVRIKR